MNCLRPSSSASTDRICQPLPKDLSPSFADAFSPPTQPPSKRHVSPLPTHVVCSCYAMNWLVGSRNMDRYSSGRGGDRAFWLQGYGARPWTPDRVKDGDNPINVPHLLWGVLGGIQPDRVASQLLAGDDDGLAARLIYTWPAPLPPRRPTVAANHAQAVDALLRIFTLPWVPPEPVGVPFTERAAEALQSWLPGSGSA